jgi:hypothetical protein
MAPLSFPAVADSSPPPASFRPPPARIPPRSLAPGIVGASPAGGRVSDFMVGSIAWSPDTTVLGVHSFAQGARDGPSSYGSYNGGEGRVEPPEALSSHRRVNSDQDSLLGHFWGRSRVSSPNPLPRAESFG